MTTAIPSVDRLVDEARRRLTRQLALGTSSVSFGVAVGSALVWFVVQPLLSDAWPEWFRWAVLGFALVAAGAFVARSTVRRAPDRRTAALEVDRRCKLRERVTTAAMMDPELRTSPAGEALLGDVQERIRSVRPAEHFPVKARWTIALAPILGLALIAVVLWWKPSPLRWNDNVETATKGGKAGQKKGEGSKATKPVVPPEKKPEREAGSKEKVDQIAEIEAELKRIDDAHAKVPGEKDEDSKPLEKLADLTKLEEKAIKVAKEKERELKDLADRLGNLDKLNKDDDFKKGPAKELNDALSKGDIDKAEEEIDELKKKLDNEELTKKETEELAKQLDEIQKELGKQEDEVERLNREKEEKKEELDKEKEKAEKEGRDEDAEQLDREIEKLEEPTKEEEEQLKDLQEQLEQAKDSLEKGDQEAAGQAMKRAKGTMQRMKSDVERLDRAKQQASKVKKERQQASADAKSKGDKAQQQPGSEGQSGDQQANGQSGKGKEDGEVKPNKGGKNDGGIGAGQRPIDTTGKTDIEESRIRSLQDLKGKNVFGGLVDGPGFKKATVKEMGQQMQRATQEAPNASDVQTLPREARDSVAEYFKKLGEPKK